MIAFDYQLLTVVVAGLLVGLSKTGLKGLAMLGVAIMAMAFPAKISLGIFLPMLVVGDLFAVSYYKRHAEWQHLWGLFPVVALGMIAGVWLLAKITNEQLKPIIGMIILSMLFIQILQTYTRALKGGKLFSNFVGTLAGITTVLGNAAGAVMNIYFLGKGLTKNKFIGTQAWFFLIINLVKIPLFLFLGLITVVTFQSSVYAIPTIIIGGILGIKIVKLLPEKTFRILVYFVTTLAGVRLLI